MSIKKYKPEQIIAVLRQIEVRMANGKTAPQACKEAGIHTQTYYRLAEGIRRAEGGAGKTAQGTGDGEWAAEAAGGRVIAGEAGAWGCGAWKLLNPERRRYAVEHAREQHGLSERHGCRLLGQGRGTQR